MLVCPSFTDISTRLPPETFLFKHSSSLANTSLFNIVTFHTSTSLLHRHTRSARDQVGVRFIELHTKSNTQVVTLHFKTYYMPSLKRRMRTPVKGRPLCMKGRSFVVSLPVQTSPVTMALLSKHNSNSM